jgi:predicted permease
MGKLFVSAGVGLAAGLICFFLSVAFLCIVLLLYGLARHVHPDMTLTYKVAAPVALLAAFTGFMITLVRSFRSATAQK